MDKYTGKAKVQILIIAEEGDQFTQLIPFDTEEEAFDYARNRCCNEVIYVENTYGDRFVPA